MRHVTLGFLVTDEKILLALKKKGFGIGHMNGIGGGVEKNETPEEAMVREAEEEIKVEIKASHVEKVSEIEFHFENRPEWELYCYVFIIRKWKGEPKETDEMAPKWFSRNKIPFEQMWADDILWLPRALAGEKLRSSFLFSHDGKEVKEYQIEKVGKF